MASSKDIRNLIVSLIILAIGIWFLIRIAKAYIGAVPSGFAEIANSLDSIATLITLGIAFLLVILVIAYFAKRSDEKRDKKAYPLEPVYKPYDIVGIITTDFSQWFLNDIYRRTNQLPLSKDNGLFSMYQSRR